MMYLRELNLFSDRKGLCIIPFGQLELLMMLFNLSLMFLEIGSDHLATATDEFLDFLGPDKPAIQIMGSLAIILHDSLHGSADTLSGGFRYTHGFKLIE